MPNLNQDLENLRRLNALRDRAKQMRELALIPLREIKQIAVIPDKENKTSSPDGRGPDKENNTSLPDGKGSDKENNTSSPDGKGNDGDQKKRKGVIPKRENNNRYFNNWLCAEDQVEIALLVKVLNNREVNKSNTANNRAEASKELKDELLRTDINSLFNLEYDRTKDQVPVLNAALTMQGLVSRAETVFSAASLICYYRIVRELYEANPPDWTVGAARVGTGGRASAFVTGECVRAICAFQKSICRTVDFLHDTERLLDDYVILRKISGFFEADENHPLRKWANRTMEVIGLDCYLSTNPRRRQIALAVEGTSGEDDIVPNLLRVFATENATKFDFDTAEVYFDSLADNFQVSVKNVKTGITGALQAIKGLREHELEKFGEHSERYYLAESAHKFAERAVEKAEEKAEEYLKFNRSKTEELDKKIEELKASGASAGEIKKKTDALKVGLIKELMAELRRHGQEISSTILKTLDPPKRYLKSVIYRELSSNEHDFDAGQLVFAATTLGAMTEWRDSDLLRRASEFLVKALPENGKMATRHPFHTNQSGYRLLPVEFEMSRSMAQLFEKTDFDITPETVEKILSIFEDTRIPLEKVEIDDDKFENATTGWNFLGSPTPRNPSVWATAVSVIALDRIVRMLNARINKAIFGHFEVRLAEDRPNDMRLYNLIYSDQGFSNYANALSSDFYSNNTQNSNVKLGKASQPQPFEKKDMSIAVYLQLMRAHVMRSALPGEYVNGGGQEHVPKTYSSILYGPPGTGKTTLAEALALNSHKAVVYLSPSDLIVQGQELMEGRARDVFEALPMLSQVVIIFDEFEQVLKKRGKDEGDEESIWDEQGDKNTETDEQRNNRLERIVEQLKIIGFRDDPKLNFLLGGMLPKFIKLNKAAKENSFVYFLGTNYLKVIDDAAQRSGRFDTKIPVYNACPLSRAGSLLYRLIKESGSNFEFRENTIESFLSLVLHTAYEPASELAQRFFSDKSDYFKNVKLGKMAEKKRLRALPVSEENYTPMEIREREWINEFEARFREQVSNSAKKDPLEKMVVSLCAFNTIEEFDVAVDLRRKSAISRKTQALRAIGRKKAQRPRNNVKPE